MRGFAAIALDNPKCRENVGGVLRAAACYGAPLVVLSGKRYQHTKTDTRKAWRHMPFLQVEDLLDVLPFGCVPVAVDLLPDAVALPKYEHPESAFYVFGAEDATLGGRLLARCRDRVYVPTNGCMNLAATVNVVLYDRRAKEFA